MSSTGTKTQTEVGAEVKVGSWVNTYNFVANETATFLLNYIDHRGLGVDKLVDMREELEDAIWTYLSSGHLTRVSVEVYRRSDGELVERFDLNYELTSPDNLDPEEVEAMNDTNFQSYHEEIMDELRTYDAPPSGCTYRILIGYRATNDLDESPPDLDGWTDAAAKSTDHLNKNRLGEAINAGPVDAEAEFWI